MKLNHESGLLIAATIPPKPTANRNAPMHMSAMLPKRNHQ